MPLYNDNDNNNMYDDSFIVRKTNGREKKGKEKKKRD